MRARIYQPARTAMSSGQGKTKCGKCGTGKYAGATGTPPAPAPTPYRCWP